jgi:F-type H+-transporting ATPase subunit epsilon
MSEGRPESQVLQVEICSMDRPAVHLEAAQLSLEGGHGAFTVFPGHAPLLSTLDIGVMTLVRPDGERIYYAINGGVVKVQENQVLILPQSFEEGMEIDLEQARKSKEKAERELNKHQPADVERMEVLLKRSLVRIRARAQSETQL